MAAARKTVLITGTGRGIGLELVRQSVAKGMYTIACCRTSTPALEEIAKQHAELTSIVVGADVDTDSGIAAIRASASSFPSIDILVNNAGILSEENLSDLTSQAGLDRMRKQFEVNTLGPLRVTAALNDKLKSGSKVGDVITSRMGSIADNTSGEMYGYRVSKAAVNAATVNLAHSLGPKGVCVMLIHPGMVATDMTSQWGGGISPEESCRGILARIEAATSRDSGKFFHQNGERLPW